MKYVARLSQSRSDVRKREIAREPQVVVLRAVTSVHRRCVVMSIGRHGGGTLASRNPIVTRGDLESIRRVEHVYRTTDWLPHISVILGLLRSPLMHYVLAAFGAVIVLWLWRGR
jgi:hypothetical protein